MEDLGTGTMEVEREREEMGWRREDPASWGDQAINESLNTLRRKIYFKIELHEIHSLFNF